MSELSVFKTKYDLICPIGEWCGPSLWMRKLGLRSCSLPLDWVGLAPMKVFVDQICGDFANFMRAENLKLLKESDDPEFGLNEYIDTATTLQSHHDFPYGVPFEKAYPVVAARFARRIARLYERVGTAHRTLFVHFARQRPASREIVLDCAARLRGKFPGSDLDLLVIENDMTLDAEIRDELSPGVVYIRGPFFPKGCDIRYGDRRLCGRIFGALRLRGRLRNLLNRKLGRLIFQLKTNCHLTSAGRKAARSKDRRMNFRGDN